MCELFHNLLAHVRRLPAPLFISAVPAEGLAEAIQELERSGTDYAAAWAEGETNLVSTSEPASGRISAWGPRMGADALHALIRRHGPNQILLSAHWENLVGGSPHAGLGKPDQALNLHPSHETGVLVDKPVRRR